MASVFPGTLSFQPVCGLGHGIPVDRVVVIKTHRYMMMLTSQPSCHLHSGKVKVLDPFG